MFQELIVNTFVFFLFFFLPSLIPSLKWQQIINRKRKVQKKYYLQIVLGRVVSQLEKGRCGPGLLMDNGREGELLCADERADAVEGILWH